MRACLKGPGLLETQRINIPILYIGNLDFCKQKLLAPPSLTKKG